MSDNGKKYLSWIKSKWLKGRGKWGREKYIKILERNKRWRLKGWGKWGRENTKKKNTWVNKK